MGKQQNAAAQTMKARTVIALPELLESCLNAGKTAMSEYSEAHARIKALDDFTAASKMIADGLYLIQSLIAKQKDSLEESAHRSLISAERFINLSESCKDFMENGNYGRYVKNSKKGTSQKANKPNVIPIEKYLTKNEEEGK
ncbi:MAG: hypothetical protein A4E69_00315 [Syntrophus sp. PtaB.Bin138]|nr:MAG: hypothetical protein A4E69_00315 [Syntrophus sp. PtaB.Bin138]